MGRRRISKPPDNTPSLCQRFEWLLRADFSNSIKVMADAIGASHAALSRVINHGQMPSAEMIVGLVGLRRVDPAWLLGADDAKSQVHLSGGQGCFPVATSLLSGLAKESPELLEPLSLPTATPFMIGDGYWYRVPAGSPLAGREAEKVAPGDLLLVAVGPAWTLRPAAYVGRIVVLRMAGSEGMLARVGAEDFFEEPQTYELDSFDAVTTNRLTTLSRSASKTPAVSKCDSKSHRLFYADDIVGVVVEKRTLYSRVRG